MERGWNDSGKGPTLPCVRERNNEWNGIDGPINYQIRSDVSWNGGRGFNLPRLLVCPTGLTLSLELRSSPCAGGPTIHLNDDVLHWEVGWVKIKFSLQ